MPCRSLHLFFAMMFWNTIASKKQHVFVFVHFPDCIKLNTVMLYEKKNIQILYSSEKNTICYWFIVFNVQEYGAQSCFFKDVLALQYSCLLVYYSRGITHGKDSFTPLDNCRDGMMRSLDPKKQSCIDFHSFETKQGSERCKWNNENTNLDTEVQNHTCPQTMLTPAELEKHVLSPLSLGKHLSATSLT